jgi:hypothetical protein
MEKVGIIKAILNDNQVLVLSELSLSITEVLSVYAEIDLPEKAKQELGIEKLRIHKGYIEVGLSQGNNLYFAERWRNKKTVRRFEDTSEVKSFTALIFGKREIEYEVPGDWSAIIEAKQSLGLSFSKVVGIGDFVGRGD